MRNIEGAYQRIIMWADQEGDCLISRYSCGSHGYTQAWDGETVVLAHRIVWEHHHGPIQQGMTVDHICHGRKCVNIDHLRLITNLQNARRNGPGDWPLDGSCKNGHDESWWMPKSSSRQKGYCYACRLVIQARRRGHRLRTDVTRPRKL